MTCCCTLKSNSRGSARQGSPTQTRRFQTKQLITRCPNNRSKIACVAWPMDVARSMAYPCSKSETRKSTASIALSRGAHARIATFKRPLTSRMDPAFFSPNSSICSSPRGFPETAATRKVDAPSESRDAGAIVMLAPSYSHELASLMQSLKRCTCAPMLEPSSNERKDS